MSSKINVVGLGYIGIPTAFILADKGYEVVGTDINPAVIEKLNSKGGSYEEPGLSELIERASCKKISFSITCAEADIYIIAVPTPFIRSNKKVDSSFLVNAIKNVCKACRQGAIIAIESTISPGTIDRDIRPLLPKEKHIHLAHVPERIIPGKIIDELSHNSRTIGADDDETFQILGEIYSSFCRGELIFTDIRTAEMTKVVENTYRDINIAFANELARICNYAGLNVYEVIRIANKHPRVKILTPGPGVGGHCISVDPWFLVGDYPGLANIILSARKINDSMPEYVLERINDIMERHQIESVGRVGFYGLTYKEDVSDIRESPTLQIISSMKKHLARGMVFYDPYINYQIVEGQVYDFYDFLARVDVVVVMVGHEHIIKNQKALESKIVFDTRNVLHEIKAEKL